MSSAEATLHLCSWATPNCCRTKARSQRYTFQWQKLAAANSNTQPHYYSGIPTQQYCVSPATFTMHLALMVLLLLLPAEAPPARILSRIARNVVAKCTIQDMLATSVSLCWHISLPALATPTPRCCVQVSAAGCSSRPTYRPGRHTH